MVMAEGVVTIPGQIALVNEGLYGPTWSGAKLGLLIDNNPYLVTDTLANHVEASFTGYARQALPWNPVNYDASAPAGADVSSAVVPQWEGPSDGSGQLITGWAIIQSSESGSGSGSPGSPILLACGPLDVAVDLIVPTNSLPLVVSQDWTQTAAAATVT
jgi:hypothetical protein